MERSEDLYKILELDQQRHSGTNQEILQKAVHDISS